MAESPAVSFETSVKDEEFADEIAQAVADEFGGTVKRNKVEFGFKFTVYYRVLEGDYDSYHGVSSDGLVFTYVPNNWPSWDEHTELGDKVAEMADFVDNEFDEVSVDEPSPVISHT